MQSTKRIGHRMATILAALATRGGEAPSKLSLEPDTDLTHRWHYAALDRLARRGLVRFVQPPAGQARPGNAVAVRLTLAGEAAYESGRGEDA